MKDAEYYLGLLLKYYGVHQYKDLVDHLDVSSQVIANWKSRNSVNSISKVCKKYGIYDNIFKNNSISEQNIGHNSGINSNINNGNQIQNPESYSSNKIEDDTILLEEKLLIKNIIEKKEIPIDTISDLITLFKIAKDKNSLELLIDNLDDFIYEQKKIIKKV